MRQTHWRWTRRERRILRASPNPTTLPPPTPRRISTPAAMMFLSRNCPPPEPGWSIAPTSAASGTTGRTELRWTPRGRSMSRVRQHRKTFQSSYPLQSKLAGARNAFVLKLAAAGNSLVYSTYLGGNSSDSGNGIAVDAAGNAYVVGDTTSLNFPASGWQRANRGGQDAFVA